MQKAGLGQKSSAWCKRPASGRPGVALGGRQSVSEQNPTKTKNKASIASAASQLPSRRDSRLRGWPLSMRETWTPPAPVSPRRGLTHPLPLAVDPGAHLFACCLPDSQTLRSRRSFRAYQTNVVPIPGPPEGPASQDHLVIQGEFTGGFCTKAYSQQRTCLRLEQQAPLRPVFTAPRP